jgi:hypothetical protein
MTRVVCRWLQVACYRETCDRHGDVASTFLRDVGNRQQVHSAWQSRVSRALLWDVNVHYRKKVVSLEEQDMSALAGAVIGAIGTLHLLDRHRGMSTVYQLISSRDVVCYLQFLDFHPGLFLCKVLGTSV